MRSYFDDKSQWNRWFINFSMRSCSCSQASEAETGF